MSYLDVNMHKFKKNNSLLYRIAQPLCPAMGSVVLIHVFFLTCGVGLKKKENKDPKSHGMNISLCFLGELAG